MTRDEALTIAVMFVRKRYPESFSNLDVEEPGIVRASVSGRSTWNVRLYYLREPDVDIYPAWLHVLVDDETGEPWEMGPKGKPTSTSWNNPWLKKRMKSKHAN
jgi:hypothetical protein